MESQRARQAHHERKLTEHVNWTDAAFLPHLNAHTALDYFCQFHHRGHSENGPAASSNPFYDRTCNNQLIRMQRLDARRLL